MLCIGRVTRHCIQPMARTSRSGSPPGSGNYFANSQADYDPLPGPLRGLDMRVSPVRTRHSRWSSCSDHIIVHDQPSSGLGPCLCCHADHESGQSIMLCCAAAKQQDFSTRHWSDALFATRGLKSLVPLQVDTGRRTDILHHHLGRGATIRTGVGTSGGDHSVPTAVRPRTYAGEECR